MNDKFSKLIVLLQTKLKAKTEERDGILSKKRKVSSEMETVKKEFSEKTETASSLRTDLKKYNRYYLKLVGNIVYIIFLFFAELITVGFLALVFFMPTVPFLKGLSNLLLNGLFAFVVGGVIGFCYTTLKSFIGSQKSCIKEMKELRSLRKKYKSKKDMKKELELVETKIQDLTSDLKRLQGEEKSLDIDLERISSELDELTRKLGITSDAFIQSSLSVQDAHIEEDLDRKYDESHIEEQVGIIDEERRISFQPIQRENQ